MIIIGHIKMVCFGDVVCVYFAFLLVTVAIATSAASLSIGDECEPYQATTVTTDDFTTVTTATTWTAQPTTTTYRSDMNATVPLLKNPINADGPKRKRSVASDVDPCNQIGNAECRMDSSTDGYTCQCKTGYEAKGARNCKQEESSSASSGAPTTFVPSMVLLLIVVSTRRLLHSTPAL